MISDANGVLREGGVVIAVGIGGGWAEALQIVFRDGVSVGAEGSEWESGFHGFEREGIDLDDVEEIFATLLTGIVIVDPGDQGVAAELEGVAAGIEAKGFGELGAVFASGAGELVGAANAVDDVGDFDQGVGGVGVGLAQIAGELGAEMADEARGYAGDERGRTGIGGNVFRAVVGDGIVGDGTGG